MKVPSNRMLEYRDAGQKLLPRTPVVVELSPITWDGSVFRGGTFLPDLACRAASALEHAVFCYTDYSSCSILLVDYPSWDRFSFRDPQELSSMAASFASLRSGNHCVAFSAKSFNLPKDEVANYFIWKQVVLAATLLRMDGLKTDPESVAGFIESGPLADSPGMKGTWWRGRACRMNPPPGSGPPSKTSPFWSVDAQTPAFSSHREYINDLVYLPK